MNSFQPFSMHGKTVLITNAGSGFGAACAQAAYTAGANLVLIDSGYAGLSVTSKEFDYRRTLCVSAKQSSISEVQQIVVAATKKFGGIDIVLVNTGTTSHPAQIFSEGHIGRRSRDTSLEGIWNTVRACLPMIKLRSGHIHITSSTYGFETGFANAPQKLPVLAAKMYARAISRELANSGASAGVLYPGWVFTPPAYEESEAFDLTIELLHLVYHGKINYPEYSNPELPAIRKPALSSEIARQCKIPFSIYSGCRNLVAAHVQKRNLRQLGSLGEMSFA